MYDLWWIRQILTAKCIDYRILKYGTRLIHSDEHKRNRRLYLLTLNLAKQKVINSEWICYVKQTLNSCNLYQCWLTQKIHVVNISAFKSVPSRHWIIFMKVAGRTQYIIVRNATTIEWSLCFEDYLVKLPVALRTAFTKYRLSNHNLPI